MKRKYFLAVMLWFAAAVLTTAAVSAGTYDVGIIPNIAGGCPAGSDYVTIYMDDEDTNNSSSMSGWVGAFHERWSSHIDGTELAFCRVDGSMLYNLGHHNLINWNGGGDPGKATVGSYTYSVMKLGTMCPNASKEFTRVVDNEDHSNQNSWSGNILPSVSTTSNKGKTYLTLCMFTPSVGGPTMSAFPDYGIGYGVFAGRFIPPSGPGHFNYWLQRGTVVTDDEDTNNQNALVHTFTSNDDFFDVAATIQYTGNTQFYLAKVRNKTMTCAQPAAWWNGSQAAQFDGANCFLRTEPSTASLFVYANKYYMIPAPSHNCPIGAFDSQNCYVRPMPLGGFVYNNGFYGLAGTGNSCPAGSAFDGVHCFYGFAPSGTTAFQYAGNFYTTPQRTCLEGLYDGANCYLGTPPGSVMPFVYGHGFYYAE